MNFAPHYDCVLNVISLFLKFFDTSSTIFFKYSMTTKCSVVHLGDNLCKSFRINDEIQQNG